MKFEKIGLLLVAFYLSPDLNAQSVAELMSTADQWMMESADSSLYYYQLAEQEALAVQQTDSLYSIYSTLLGFYNYYGNHEQSVRCAEEKYRFSASDTERGKSLISLGKAYEHLDLIRSDSFYQEAAIMAEAVSDSTLYFNLYFNYGNYKLFTADFHGGINDLVKATTFNDNDYTVAQLYVKIAGTYLFLDNYTLAENYTLKALALCKENDYQYGQGSPRILQAKILIHNQEYHRAAEILEEVINYGKTIDNKTVLVSALMTKTDLLLAQEKWVIAETANEEAMGYLNQVSTISQSSLLNQQSLLLLRQNHFQEVIENTRKVYGLFGENAVLMANQTAAQYAAQAYEKLGFPQKALDYFRQYKLIEDSLFRSRQSFYFNEVEARYNRQQQANDIAVLDAQNNLQSIQISQQRLFLTWGGIGLFTILGLVLFLARSIGRIKQQNQLIAVALTEKDLLLREIHHRVKNNLQLVSSLLGLQSRYIDDPNAQEALRAGKARVKSMSLIHQDLYQKEELTSVSVREYFDKLCKELMYSYQVDSQQIQLTTEIEDLELDVDTLVPLGLIINELLTNAFKYAFPKGRTGIIQVALFEKEESLHLHVGDNGVGMRASDTTNSFGYKLIHTLVAQLEGELRQGDTPGTQLYFSFHDYKK